MPVAVWNVSPVGSAPDSENVVVPTPPVCVNWTLNGVPAGSDVVAGFVTVMVWQLIVSVYVAPVPVQPLLSVTVTTIGKLPITVGVPESVPFVANVRPAGSVLAVVNAAVPCAPLCVKVRLKAASTVPVFVTGVVTVMVWQLIVSVYD